MPRIAIIGLGLIGGSVALALKRAALRDLEVVGYDIDVEASARARKLTAIDIEAPSPALAAEGAAAVIIATPVLKVRDVLEQIAGSAGEGALITDTASTKREVVRWADEVLPDGVSFVGGHPIAGKTESGIGVADAALFEGRPWTLSPSISASERAIATLENLVRLTGAEPVIIDAEEHDSYLAAVSHLPLLAATALFALTSESKAWPELAPLAGPGFRDTTRLASTNPGLSHDICLTNRENLLHWLDRYRATLTQLRELIADTGHPEALIEAFARVQATRDAFLEAPPPKPEPVREQESISAGERMLSFMVGEYVVRRTKEVEQMIREREQSGEGRDNR
jgi:prephenate dehydrogenase